MYLRWYVKFVLLCFVLLKPHHTKGVTCYIYSYPNSKPSSLLLYPLLLRLVARNHNSYDRSEMPVMVNFIIKNIEDAMKNAQSDERFCLIFDLRQFGLACVSDLILR